MSAVEGNPPMTVNEEVVSEAASVLLESDAMTSNSDGTPDHYYVDPENVEYLVTTVLAAAVPVLRAEDAAEIARLRAEIEDVDDHWTSVVESLAADADERDDLWAGIKALADEAADEYREAIDEIRSLQPGTREYGEWSSNAATAKELQDRMLALLKTTTTTEGDD